VFLCVSFQTWLEGVVLHNPYAHLRPPRPRVEDKRTLGLCHRRTRDNHSSANVTIGYIYTKSSRN
jgi:hypothetical protein